MEELRLQSIHLPNMKALTRFPNEFIRDLSGNAFEGSCCAAVIFCSHVLLSKGAAARERASNVQSKAASPAEVDADPTDSESQQEKPRLNLHRESHEIDIQSRCRILVSQWWRNVSVIESNH